MSENRPTRANLAEYYGTHVSGKISDVVESVKRVEKSGSASPINMEAKTSSPYDINSSSFDPELYSQKVIKEAPVYLILAFNHFCKAVI